MKKFHMAYCLIPVAAAAVLVLFTLYGELRSINTMVERAPGLRHLDSFGRTHRA